MKRHVFGVGMALAGLSLILSSGGCGIIGGGLLGGIIGYQSGEALAGAAIGAAVCGAGDIARAVGDLGKPKCPPKPTDCTVTVKIRNENGSFTPVTLVKRGCEYIGPQGEHYSSLPTEEQLRPYYGIKAAPGDGPSES